MFLTLAYAALVVLRIAWVFLPQTGYIHPDEFFQFSERVAADVFGYETAPVWEFDSSRPLRSVFFPFLICGLPFAALREMAARMSSPPAAAAAAPLSGYWLLVAPRLVMAALSLVVDRCLHVVCRALGVDAMPSLLLFASSYATLVLCTRTLSNAVETVLLALLLALVVRDARLCGRLRSRRRRLQQAAAADAAPDATAVDTGSASSSSSMEDGAASSRHQLDSPMDDEKKEELPIDGNHVSDAHFTAAAVNEADDGGGGRGTTDPPGLPQQQQTPSSARARLAEAYRAVQSNNFLIVTVVVAGFFNRPTFLAFAAAPCWYWLLGGSGGGATSSSASSSVRLLPRPADACRALVTCLCCAPYALNVAAMLVLWDTYYYRSFDAAARQLGTSGDGGLISAIVGSFVLTPLNFLAYNSDPSNLAEHGTHPRYLHAAVNVPLLLGPVAPLAAAAAILLWLPGGGSDVSSSSGRLRRSKRQSPTTTTTEQHRSRLLAAAAAVPDGGEETEPEAEVDGDETVDSSPPPPSSTLAIGRMLAATLVVPLLCLSVFPHQEPRFLLPLVAPATLLTGASLRRLLPGRRPRCAFVAVWLAFNAAGGALYGVAHQGGLVPALLRLGDGRLLLQQQPAAALASDSAGGAAGSPQPTAACRGGRLDVVFYHTYMPPLHLLGRPPTVAGTAELGEGCDLVVHDLKGADGAVLRSALGELLSAGGEALLVTPLDAADLGLGGAYSASVVARFFPHVTFEDLPPVRRLLALLPGGRLDRTATLSNARRAFSLSVYRVTDALLRDHLLSSGADAQLTVSVIINTPALAA